MDPRPATHDMALLFAARSVRMFGYGLLAWCSCSTSMPSACPAGRSGCCWRSRSWATSVISLWLTTHADRWVTALGRRRVLVVGAMLLLAAGLVFSATPVFVVLLVAATIGVISPSGNEVGPFLAVEQASLAQLAPPARRTLLFARYQIAGSVATAFGALAAGLIVETVARRLSDPTDAYRAVIVGLRPRGHHPGRARLAHLTGRRGAAGRGLRRDHPLAPRAARLPARRAPPLRALRPRCLRRRLRHEQLHRLLVQPALRRRSSPPGGHPLRRQHPGCHIGAGGCTVGGTLRAWCGRWSSRTCRPTCC